MNANGPTDEFPDPIPADGSAATPTRPPPKKRLCTESDVSKRWKNQTQTNCKQATNTHNRTYQ